MTASLTGDAQVTLLLCSHLAMPKGHAAAGLRPLAPAEWNKLASVMLSRKVRPGALLEMDKPAMQTELGLTVELTERIAQLLARGVHLAIELERLGGLGIWVLTRSDESYPGRLKERLGSLAPPILFGAGERALLARGFLAVVGSRDVDEVTAEAARQVGEACARDGLVVVSGGARGVDRRSMSGCLAAGGTALGVLPDGLERAIREPEFRTAIIEERLALVSAVHPKAPFTVANAMARNKFIYCLAQYGLVIAASTKGGGTRAGALEVLNHRWVPLFIRDGDSVPDGNRELIRQGALVFPAVAPAGLAAWCETNAAPWGQAGHGRSRRALTTPVKANPDDLFPVVWPHIAERLAKWPRVAEMARHLQVERSQFEAWLDRAERLGLVCRGLEAGTYRLTDAAAGERQTRLTL